tara:strand:- start:1581 stop:1718 length:138 start_codon:yes stop_codon:yes gene_type:complete
MYKIWVMLDIKLLRRTIKKNLIHRLLGIPMQENFRKVPEGIILGR